MDIEKLVLNTLNQHKGEDSIISRWDLLCAINAQLGWWPDNDEEVWRQMPGAIGPRPMKDRRMRDIVSDLMQTREGCMIVSTLRGGYFVAETEEELKKYLGPEWQRVKTLLKKLKIQAEYAGIELGGQLEFS